MARQWGDSELALHRPNTDEIMKCGSQLSIKSAPVVGPMVALSPSSSVVSITDVLQREALKRNLHRGSATLPSGIRPSLESPGNRLSLDSTTTLNGLSLGALESNSLPLGNRLGSDSTTTLNSLPTGNRLSLNSTTTLNSLPTGNRFSLDNNTAFERPVENTRSVVSLPINNRLSQGDRVLTEWPAKIETNRTESCSTSNLESSETLSRVEHARALSGNQHFQDLELGSSSTINAEDSSIARPSSLMLPLNGNGAINGLTLSAVAAEAHLRHCPILFKDLSCETADDEENENHLTISSLTARPLIAKCHELRTRKVAKKIRRATRRACVRRFKPPDGGYGWAVVLGAFIVQFCVTGLLKSYGVLFVEVMEAFSDTSAAVAAWIPAILSTLCLALAPVTSALCLRYTCRTVVFIGGLFCAAGLITSSFVKTPLHLLFTFGVLTGIGGGLSTTPGILLVSRYFDRHRALANGICISGTAAGSIIFPFLIPQLIYVYGFHGTILLLGGLMLQVCVSAALYRPLAVHQRIVEIASGQSVDHEPLAVDITVQCEDPIQGTKKLEFLFINEPPQENLHKTNSFPNIPENQQKDGQQSHSDNEEDRDKLGELLQVKPIFIRSSSILHSVEDLTTDSTCVYKDKKLEEAILHNLETVLPDIAEARRKKTYGDKLRRYLDISLLKNGKFQIMCCSVTLMSAGCPYMLYFLPAHAISTGHSKSDAAILMIVSAGFDLIGRLGLGYLSDQKSFDRKKGYFCSIVGAGLTVMLIPLAGDFYLLAALAGIYGLCLGSWFLLVPVLLADDYGTKKISSTYGLVRLFQSIGAMTIPPLSGYLRDLTGKYNACFYTMGTCMLLAGLVILLEPILLRRQQQQRRQRRAESNGKT